jgi:putative metal-binding protein/matrixin
MRAASIVAGHSDYADDVACCITIEREGTAGTVGTPGDGLDIIDNETELYAMLDAGPRVKVVRQINWCGSAGTNIIGCSYLSQPASSSPGKGMVVVKLSVPAFDGALWLHEYGHNAGLGHSADPRAIMYFAYDGRNSLLTQFECDRYHIPLSMAQMTLRDLGACNDADRDQFVTTADNCPTKNNPDQSDDDSDRVGTVCDNCPALSNADQTDVDTDTLGDTCDPCVDRDHDGYGSPASVACSDGDTLDCNDTSAVAHPGGTEVCDGLDNDCDGGIDNSRCKAFDVSSDERVDGVELAWIGRAFGSCSLDPSSEWWGPVNYTRVDGDDLAVLGAAWACDTTPVCAP